LMHLHAVSNLISFTDHSLQGRLGATSNFILDIHH
jgi:hypothetical protein